MDMTRFRYATFPALILSTVLVLGACGDSDDNSGGESTANAGAGADGHDSADGSQAALTDLYRGALDGLNVDDFRDPEVTAGELTGDFEYAVADLNADETEELLIQAKGTEFSSIRVFGAAEDNASLVKTSKIFHAGAAGAGGMRMSVETTTDNSGLLSTSGLAGTGETETALWSYDGAEMHESGQTWHYRIDQIPSELTSLEQKINWTPVGDLSGLDDLGEGTAEVETGSEGGPQPTSAGDAGNGDNVGGDGNAGSSGGTLPQSATAPSSQIGGECGTVDGATVTAGGSTSCGFAMAVAQEAMQPVYGEDTISPADANGYAGVASVTATSPTNGQTYTMQCGIGSAGDTSICSGGNNADVRISKSGNGSLLNLVN